MTDVDGVLNDGKRFFTNDGETTKIFHVRDGMAVNILLRNNIPTVILTKEKSSIVIKWAKDMNVSMVMSGIQKKEITLSHICKKFNVEENEIAYIGDDVNDAAVLQRVGFSACPRDASDHVKKIVDYKCKTCGGHGTLREICDIILLSKYGDKTIWY